MIDEYPDVFKDELGQLPGEAQFITDPSVTPAFACETLFLNFFFTIHQ